MTKLSLEYYRQADTLLVARALLGKTLFVQHDASELCGGVIVETEAYCGENDAACHAHTGRFTNRTKTMFLAGGVAYVYLCYGVHNLFNVVTHGAGEPHAILIRAIEPTVGIETMMRRRKQEKLKTTLTSGPGSLSAALGIDKTLNEADLTGDQIWIADEGRHYSEEQIIASPRVGVDFAGDDALLPYRFRLKCNRWTSPAK